MNTSRLVLLGGGHAHIQVLKNFRMRPIENVEVFLVSDQLRAPYSGMLPGRLAGWFADEDMHFDLPQLCAQSGVTFVWGAVESVDLNQKTVQISGRAPLAFDFLSVNIGIRPSQAIDVLDRSHIVALKPISELLERWKLGGKSWAVIGAGAAGYEVATVLALDQTREVTLIEMGSEVLSHHSAHAKHLARASLERLNVKVLVNCSVTQIDGRKITFETGTTSFDQIILATAASAPAWFKKSEWKLANGYLKVNRTLQSESHPYVFGAGDCVEFDQLPKAGVYAVRQGPILAQNLRAIISGHPLTTYKPQKRFLSLLVSGTKRALLSYGGIAIEGEWVWKWKEHIDRKFMERFQPMKMKPMNGDMLHNTCGGCGAKVSGSLLAEVLPQIGASRAYEDAVPLPDQENLVSTIDGFRAFTTDHFFFAQVAAWHAFNDLFASGAAPQQVNVFVSVVGNGQQRAQMLELMRGVQKVLELSGAVLGNAHTAEGAETVLVFNALGKTLNAPWPKGGARNGDYLILTKPIGTGASLQGQSFLASDEWRSLHDHLLKSHVHVREALAEIEVHGCTDISGFGLVGHIREMLEANGLSFELGTVPSLTSFDKSFANGVSAFLTKENRRSYLIDVEGNLDLKSLDLLFDPQTHGPLAIAVSQDDVEKTLQSLKRIGFSQAVAIGKFVTRGKKKIILS